jgi:hypothetical protein
MALEPGDHVWYWDGRVSQAMNIPQSQWFPGFTGPTDYQGHGREIYNYVIYDDQIVRGQPQMRNFPGTYAWLDNNPGNIKGQPGGPDFGQYQGKFNGHNFLVFPTWDAGFAAIAQVLRGPKYTGLSIADAFERYAPAADGNDPVRYAQEVAQSLGVPPSTIVGDLDDDQMIVMQNKITDVEGAVGGDAYAYDSPELPAELTDLLP